jgi:hypothetical protein
VVSATSPNYFLSVYTIFSQCYAAETICFSSGSRFHKVLDSAPAEVGSCEHNFFLLKNKIHFVVEDRRKSCTFLFFIIFLYNFLLFSVYLRFEILLSDLEPGLILLRLRLQPRFRRQNAVFSPTQSH